MVKKQSQDEKQLRAEDVTDESEMTDEAHFLASYDITEYDRPSIATDIAVFSMFSQDAQSHRKDSEPKLHILLIRRGEHPFKNFWALPGGFLRPDETVEACAIREVTEETSLCPISLLPIGVFSEPLRDPRGRIVSNAFASIVGCDITAVKSGSDAAGAQWFEIEFDDREAGRFKLKLVSQGETLEMLLQETENRFGNRKFEIISNSGLAFDHAKIIAAALCVLKKEAQNLSVTFDFLPEKFTLAALQRVQEILTNTSLLTANFRRKIADYVQETEEYTEGVGHRPARLFMRKEPPNE